MTKRPAKPAIKSDRPNAYQAVTDKLIAVMESGTVPWHKPWAGSAAPVSIHGHEYRGINALILGMCSPYASNVWLTYNQARERGGNVRKGEKGTTVILFRKRGERPGDKKAESADDKKKSPVFAATFTVFNIEQCDGVELPAKFAPIRSCESPIEAAEAIAAGFVDGPKVQHGGARACYRPLSDVVTMPRPESFDTRAHYYSTLFHELTHATGHASRLDRLETGFTFGDHAYSKEELVAELGASILSNRAGIENAATVENSAAYLKGWLLKLSDDRQLLVQAASAAFKAVDVILGVEAKAEQKVAA